MKLIDYIFNVGDEVITVEGERGHVTYVCHCERCLDRGFFEPSWEDETGEMHYISKYEAENGFNYYYKVGNYRFNSFDKYAVNKKIARHKSALEQLEKQLRFIEEVEKE